MTPLSGQSSPFKRDEQRYLGLARKIVLSHLQDEDCRVFLYGSRANGTASWRSDIDIGFLCDQPLDKKSWRKFVIAWRNPLCHTRWI